MMSILFYKSFFSWLFKQDDDIKLSTLWPIAEIFQFFKTFLYVKSIYLIRIEFHQYSSQMKNILYKTSHKIYVCPISKICLGQFLLQ